MGPILRFPRKMALLLRVATACGASLWDRGRLWLCGFILYVCDVLPIQKNFTVSVYLNGRSANLQVSSFGDYTTLEEIFLERVYELPHGLSPEAIIDLGSNIGIGVAYFTLCYPQAQIWAFEPDPNNWQRLKNNVNNLHRVQIFNVAAAADSGTALFSADAHRGTSSGLFGEDMNQSVRVETWSLDYILEKIDRPQIDLVKFDIEGAEYGVFESFTGWDRVEVFSGELHQMDTQGTPEALCALFTANGFDVELKGDDERGVIHMLAIARCGE